MSDHDAIIIGAGPGGCSAAISLAERGARVLLLEEKRMPRDKLCGEFVAGECLPSLERLGVLSDLMMSGAHRINRVKLVAPGGRTVESSISDISSTGDGAISISRSRFDQVLFQRAREAGVVCLQGFAVKQTVCNGSTVTGVEGLALPSGTKIRFEAPFVVDASGRNSRLALDRRERVGGSKGSRLYAMKAHFTGIEEIDDQVELYFFPSGYGGLTRIEAGLVNLCFIVREEVLRSARGNPTKVLERSVLANPIARDRLRAATQVGQWLTAGPLTFGRRRGGSDGVIAIGDAAGMIDPFTGTGIQMALRTGEIAADCIAAAASPRDAAGRYEGAYWGEFGKRLKAAGLLRRLASSPAAAELAARLLTRFPELNHRMLRATRRSGANGGSP